MFIVGIDGGRVRSDFDPVVPRSVRPCRGDVVLASLVPPLLGPGRPGQVLLQQGLGRGRRW